MLRHVRQGEFQTEPQTKLFLEKNEDIKSLWLLNQFVAPVP